MSSGDKVRIGMYGAGGHCVTQHLPNLKSFENVEVVAIADIDGDRARQAAADFGVPSSYADGLQMVEEASLDAIWSLVPAAARPDVEIAAAERGIHLFCDKPQTLDMKQALDMDEALRRSGVLGTVCFRERYRPLFQEAKRLLEDKEVSHIRFQQVHDLPSAQPDIDTPGWENAIELHATFLGWGPHAIDYCRFVSGLDIVRAQAFFCEPERFQLPTSTVSNFVMSNGATMSMTFLHTSPHQPDDEPLFLFYYEGGYLAIRKHLPGIEMNGELVFKAEEFQPWRELDRVFVNAISTRDGSALLNDFSDGLKTHAPLLAAWESSQRGGVPIDVATYMATSQ